MSNLKRFLALTLAMLMVVGAMAVSAKSFTDVASTDSYAEAVDVLSELGVIAGTSTDEFSPDALVERQQMAMFIARLATAQPALFAGEAGAIFKDQKDPTYNAAIQYAYTNGIIAGRTATEFDGPATVTLQEAAAMLSRALGYGNKTNNAAYPFSYMVIANEIGLLAGLEDVAPTAELTRGEVATMLYNALFAPKADRQVLYTPDGQDFIVSIPDSFYGDVKNDSNVVIKAKGSFDSLITKAWKATVVEAAYINATLKAGIDVNPTTATKAISDPVTLNKGIATTKAISFATLSKYFEEDVTADDMLGVELKLIIRNGSILKLDVIGSKKTTNNASYDKDNKILTVDSEKYNLSNYLDKVYPAESDNCIYTYVNNEIERIETITATTYQQIADGFFTFDVINEGLATQMLVYKPLSFGKVTDKDANGKLQINDNTALTLTTTAGAVKDNFVAYFNGGNKNIDVYAIAVKSNASKAVKINNTAKTATLADGTVVSTAGTTVVGATLGTIALNQEFHVFTVDGKIISSVAKDAPTATYAPQAYYYVDDVLADAFAGSYRAKIVNNTGSISTINVTKVNGSDITSGLLNDIKNKVIVVDGTEVYTITTPAKFFTTFDEITDKVEAPTTATLTSPAKVGTVFTVNGVNFVLNDYSKIVIKGSTTSGYASNSGKTLAGFATQDLSGMVLITRTNKAGVNELVYLFAVSNVAKDNVFTGATPITSNNLYLFISENEITADSIKYKAMKLATGAIEEVTYAKAAASIGAHSLVYDVKSSDATPAAYTYAESTAFKLSAGYVVTADKKIYTADGVKYYQWNPATDKMIFEEKTLDKFTAGKAYTGIIVKNGNNVDYVIVDTDASTDTSISKVFAETLPASTAGDGKLTTTPYVIAKTTAMANTVVEIKTTDITAAAGAKVELYSAGFAAVDADGKVALSTGANIVYIKVTAQDFTTVTYYTVTVTVNP